MPKVSASQIAGGLARAAMLPVGLLLPAGTTRWWEAWALSAEYLVFSGVVVAMLARHDPQLLAQRLRASPVQEGQPGWDRALMVSMSLAALAMLVVPGLDVVRFGWTERLPLAVELVGLAVQVPALAFVGWVFRTNPWLVRVVRITADQEVVTTGPYAWVRHPMYLGLMLAFLGFPLALGSRWGLLAAGVVVVLLVARTALEDRALRRELPGYAAYTARTRWRLVPGIW